MSLLNRYAWGVCPCSTPEPADYLSAQGVVWDTRALRLALPEILHSRGNSSSWVAQHGYWKPIPEPLFTDFIVTLECRSSHEKQFELPPERRRC